MRMNPQNLTLDASESLFFKRELESIDKKVYAQLYPENNARDLIQVATDIPEWARVYTWRMLTRVGRAKFIGDAADDLPMVDVHADEQPKIIKPLGDSYKWDIFEIKAAAATGMPLEAERATTARHKIDDLIDETLMVGSVPHNLDGLLTLTGTQTLGASVKSGGGTTWANATPKEIAADVTSMIFQIVETLENSKNAMFSRFVVVVPYKQYGILTTTQYSQSSDKTIAEWLLGIPYIEDIQPSRWAKGIGALGVDRMAVFPRTSEVISGIVPVDFVTEPPEKRNLTYVVNCWATCGGVVARYPVAIGYMDGI